MATVLEPSIDRAPAPESSDRSFGLVFAGVFTLIALLPLLHGAAPRWWAFVVAAVLALAALVRPQSLGPLNRIWLALGRALHRVVSPLVMGAVFFLCVTPIAWIMRWRGKDVLSLRRRGELSSYWITRSPAAPDADSMRRQF
jgi:hypothetical protein